MNASKLLRRVGRIFLVTEDQPHTLVVKQTTDSRCLDFKGKNIRVEEIIAFCRTALGWDLTNLDVTVDGVRHPAASAGKVTIPLVTEKLEFDDPIPAPREVEFSQPVGSGG